jgi:hypothetical protein
VRSSLLVWPATNDTTRSNVTQLCIYAGEELQTPIFVCFKTCPSIRLDVQVHIGRALRLDWLPHFKQVISAAIERGIKKKLVYPARMECFIPYPGRKLDVNLVSPAQPVIARTQPKNTKIWDIYTYLDSKKHQKKIRVVAQFIDEILNKSDYSRTCVIASLCLPATARACTGSHACLSCSRPRRGRIQASRRSSARIACCRTVRAAARARAASSEAPGTRACRS